MVGQDGLLVNALAANFFYGFGKGACARMPWRPAKR